MNRADKSHLDSLEVKLKSIHQPHLECPSHELAYDEDDFQRVFGAGDEQPVERVNINQAQEDAGHNSGDFC